MDLFRTISYGGGGGGGHEIMMKFGTGVKFDVFYKKVCDITTNT